MSSRITTATYQIRLDEVDSQHRLTITALVGYLQEIAWLASVEGNVPIPVLLEKGITWVLSRFQLEVFEFPKYADTISIQTYAPSAEKFFVQRDFKVYQNEKLIAEASSNWLIVEMKKKKLTQVPEFILEALVNPNQAKIVMNTAKIAELQKSDYQYNTSVRWHDLDINQHTNNKHYFRWALDALPAEILENRSLQKLDMQFRLETVLNENLQIQAEKVNENQFLHRIIQVESGKEIIRGRSVWN